MTDLTLASTASPQRCTIQPNTAKATNWLTVAVIRAAKRDVAMDGPREMINALAKQAQRAGLTIADDRED